MEEPITPKLKNTKRKSDVNGNRPKSTPRRKPISPSPFVKDQVIAPDGTIFYPCPYCNKVFPKKISRTFHVKKCEAKEYILSDGNLHQSIPIESPPSPKIDIKQNIVLNQQLSAGDILNEPKSPPLKMTIKRSPRNGNETRQFTIMNSPPDLKDQNEENAFNLIAKRLQSNSVTITPQSIHAEAEQNKPKRFTNKNEPPKLKPQTEFPSDDSEPFSDSDDAECSELACVKCHQEFKSPIALLRHSRNCNRYPRVLMALSEVKKYYSAEDRSLCPICDKPLSTNFKSAFVKHLHTHTKEMKYSCTVCKKKFRRNDHMKAHMKRHDRDDAK